MLVSFNSYSYIRSSDGKYQCGFSGCSKKFEHKRSVGRHFRTHSKIKKYMCKICDHESNRKDNIRSHVMKVHKIEVNVNPLKKFKKIDAQIQDRKILSSQNLLTCHSSSPARPSPSSEEPSPSSEEPSSNRELPSLQPLQPSSNREEPFLQPLRPSSNRELPSLQLTISFTYPVSHLPCQQPQFFFSHLTPETFGGQTGFRSLSNSDFCSVQRQGGSSGGSSSLPLCNGDEENAYKVPASILLSLKEFR